MCAQSLSHLWLFETLWIVAAKLLFPWDFSGHFLLWGTSQPRECTCVSCVSCVADGFFTAKPWSPFLKAFASRNIYFWGLPCWPVVKNLLCNSGTVGLSSDWGTKISHPAGQLSPCTSIRAQAKTHCSPLHKVYIYIYAHFFPDYFPL